MITHVNFSFRILYNKRYSKFSKRCKIEHPLLLIIGFNDSTIVYETTGIVSICESNQAMRQALPAIAEMSFSSS